MNELPTVEAPRYWCSKCGYRGLDIHHQRPNGTGECGYIARLIAGVWGTSSVSQPEYRAEQAAKNRAARALLDGVLACDDSAALLRIFQSRLGESRDQCDEPGRKLWDRIERALGVTTGDRVQRLMDACEGEAGGLALQRAAARRILAYVDGGTTGLIAEAAKLGEEAGAGVAAAPAPDLGDVLIVLERLLPQHKTDSMRGQIEAAITLLRSRGVIASDGSRAE